MDGCTWQSFVVEEIVKVICSLLAVDEYHNSGWRHGQQKVKEGLAFSSLIYKYHLEKT